LKPTEESGKTGKIIYPSVETDGKREPAAWGKAPLKRHNSSNLTIFEISILL